jgi:hypothetical protein
MYSVYGLSHGVPAVACVPAVDGLPAITGILAVASVVPAAGVPAIAGGSIPPMRAAPVNGMLN